MKNYYQSNKLNSVCYDIRGPILKEAQRLEAEGHNILKLNIGNPATFGFEAPDNIVQDIIVNLNNAQGYCDSKGLTHAREAVVQYSKKKNITNVSIDDIYIGNGVSELIVISMQGLLNNGDEILIPCPDYPLWTAAVNLSGGKAVPYICDEQSDWYPDIEDIKSKISEKTKGIVVINPNNPTGSLYPVDILHEIVSIARKNELIIFSDEIYDKIVYDGKKHISIASLTDEILFITFNGLSKSYRAAGFRCGWMVVSGNKKSAASYIEGLDILASMRLCSNVPAQYAIQASLGGYQSIDELILPGGRLREQRDFSYSKITSIPGISCVKPSSALYLFPKIDLKKYPVQDDEKLVLDLLLQEKILVVQGKGFGWSKPDHFRIVFLPDIDDLDRAITKIGKFFDGLKYTE